MYLKQVIFHIFEIARMLFNNYYNGHDGNFTEEEKEKILFLVNELETLIKEIKDYL